ncbi:hypothetical protein [Spirosoma endbachense]|uniref:Uncharacterized protein n=1 Tax=Spirosoma endbachense TaxID=2666025 RepID=A0A6P1W3V6_9BACT|nr:hypothetical protein [Spirosoma endbachense]QHV98689.1 hypothetical protein GJR95_28410 [Spirosoma endbachense]
MAYTRSGGPAEYSTIHNLPGSGDYDWGDQIGSVRTGSQCWVVVYTDENVDDTTIVIGPDSQISDLRGLEYEIDSIQIFDRAP